MTEQERWRQKLDRRVERFAKLVALNAPSYVLCSDFVVLAKALAGLHPEAFGQVVGAAVQKAARVSMGLCVFCGEPHERNAVGEEWCRPCEDSARAEAEADDAKIEAEESAAPSPEPPA